MSRVREQRRRQQGYVLLFVVLLSAAIVTSAGTVAMLTEVEARASSRNIKAVQAMSIAYSGLMRGLKAVDNDRGTAITGLNSLLGAGTTATLDTVVFHEFANAADLRTGGTAYTVGDGKYKLYLLDDVEEKDGDNTRDSNRTVVVRSYGWVGEAEAMLEAPYTVPLLTSFPGAFVACLEDPGGQVWFGAQGNGAGGLGPGWPRMHWRIDGSKNKFNAPMPAILSSSNPYSMDGMSLNVNSVAFNNKWMFLNNPDRVGNQYGGAYFTWFGWANNTSTAATGELHVVDEGYNAGAAIGTGQNMVGQRPLGLTNVPLRLVGKDALPSVSASLASIVDSTEITRYKAPTIAWGYGPADHAGYDNAERDYETLDGDFTDFATRQDDKAMNGFYGCPNDDDTGENAYQAISGCLSGNGDASSALAQTTPSSGTVGSLSEDTLINNSGLAWNVIQTVLRKCSGSGAGASCCNNSAAPCSGDFRAFENVAQCLILPANVKRNWGALGDIGGTEASYQDRSVSAVAAALGHLGALPVGARVPDQPPDSALKSWWPFYYSRLDIDTSAWTVLATTEALAEKGLCETQYPAGWAAYAPATAYHNGSIPCGVIATACTYSDTANKYPCGRTLVKYCDREESDTATYPNGKARAYTAGTGWSWVDCLDPTAWAPESCDDGYSMSLTHFYGLSTTDTWGEWNALLTDTDEPDLLPDFDACDDYKDAPGCCGDEGESDGALDRLSDMGNPKHVATGDFTSCAPGCAFEWDDTAAAIAVGGNRPDPNNRMWRSTCINLDPWHVHNYGPSDSPTARRGERGSPHFITRLDLSDDGPLGSCNHIDNNHRILKDRGTCMTSGRNNFTANSVGAPQFSDTDGAFTFMQAHPGKGMTAPFSRTVDGEDTWLPATKTPTSFCTAGSGDAEGLDNLFNDVFGAATGVTISAAATSWTNGTEITANGGVCRYTSDKVNGVELGWYVKQCNSWDAYKKSNSSSIGGIICGCGLLTVQAGGGVAKLRMNGNSNEAVVWRGLVVFTSAANATGVELSSTSSNDDKHKLLFVDGGFLSLLVDAAGDMRVEAAVTPDATGIVRTYIRFNQAAIDDALSDVNLPLRGFRILY